MFTEQIEALMQTGDWEGAKQLCLQLRAEHPENAKLAAYLGLCHHHFGDVEPAIGELKRSLVLDPTFWQAGLKVVKILDKLQRYEEALDVARQVETHRPSDPELQALIRGLERQIPDKVTDNWQLSRRLPHYSVDIKGDS